PKKWAECARTLPIGQRLVVLASCPGGPAASAQRFFLGLHGGQDHLDAGLLAKGGAEAQVIGMDAAAAVLGVGVVAGAALAVGVVDVVPDALFGGGLDVGGGLGILPPPGQRRIDKDVQHVCALRQHIVGAAAQDDAGVLVGQLFDDP